MSSAIGDNDTETTWPI